MYNDTDGDYLTADDLSPNIELKDIIVNVNNVSTLDESKGLMSIGDAPKNKKIPMNRNYKNNFKQEDITDQYDSAIINTHDVNTSIDEPLVDPQPPVRKVKRHSKQTIDSLELTEPIGGSSKSRLNKKIICRTYTVIVIIIICLCVLLLIIFGVKKIVNKHKELKNMDVKTGDELIKKDTMVGGNRSRAANGRFIK